MSLVDDARQALALADEASSKRDVAALVAHLSAAVRGFTAAGDYPQAAMACVRLGDVLSNAMGNLTAGRAWFSRARRLVADEPPCIEQGWVAVAAMGCDVDDPAALLADAELALDRARRFGDVNLETKALADAGLAHVQAGRVVEGMAMLDEAMALACGPADDSGGRRQVGVLVLHGVLRVGRLRTRRVVDRPARRPRVMIGFGPRAAVFLSSHCDSVQAGAAGRDGAVGRGRGDARRCQRADFEADDARRRAGTPTSGWPSCASARAGCRGRAAADRQGPVARRRCCRSAQLHLARGDHELARAAARRGLRAIGDDRLRAIELLVVLVEAEVAAGDLEARRPRRAPPSPTAARSLECATLRARSALAHGARGRRPRGDLPGAIAVLESTVDEIDPIRLRLAPRHVC